MNLQPDYSTTYLTHPHIHHPYDGRSLGSKTYLHGHEIPEVVWVDRKAGMVVFAVRDTKDNVFVNIPWNEEKQAYNRYVVMGEPAPKLHMVLGVAYGHVRVKGPDGSWFDD